jgi:hypothetical protein
VATSAVFEVKGFASTSDRLCLPTVLCVANGVNVVRKCCSAEDSLLNPPSAIGMLQYHKHLFLY